MVTTMLSRKFIITLLTLISTVALAYLGKLGTDTALVLSACVTAYNGANAWSKGKAND